MNQDWQTYSAITVVILTAGVFAFRMLTRKKSGCGGGCGCAAPRKPGPQAK